MPLDVLGRTRATLAHSASSYPGSIGLGNLSKCAVIGLDDCNYSSSTRNA